MFESILELLDFICKINSCKEECMYLTLRESAQYCAGWVFRTKSEQLQSEGQYLQGFVGSASHAKHSFYLYLNN